MVGVDGVVYGEGAMSFEMDGKEKEWKALRVKVSINHSMKF